MPVTFYSIFLEDQADRKLARAGKMKNTQLLLRDRARRVRAKKLLEEKGHFNKNDYFYLSVLFHHAATLASLKKAQWFVEKSREMKHPKAGAMLEAIKARMLFIREKISRK